MRGSLGVVFITHAMWFLVPGFIVGKDRSWRPNWRMYGSRRSTASVREHFHESFSAKSAGWWSLARSSISLRSFFAVCIAFLWDIFMSCRAVSHTARRCVHSDGSGVVDLRWLLRSGDPPIVVIFLFRMDVGAMHLESATKPTDNSQRNPTHPTTRQARRMNPNEDM
jgi:hypothetical protein